MNAGAVFLVALGTPMSLAFGQAGHHSDPTRFMPVSVLLPTPRTEVPIRLVQGYRAVVSATLNGQGPFVFAIETGAPFVIITERTARAAHLLPAAPATAASDAGHHWPGGAPATRFVVDSLRMGDVVLRGQPMVTGPELLAGVDGILGLPAYAGLTMTVDYPGERLVFDRQGLPAPDGREIFPLLPLRDLLGVTVQIAGRDYPAVIDTQGGTDVQVPPELADGLRFVSPPIPVGQARIGTDAPVTTSAARLDGDLRLGAFTIARPIVHVTPVPADTPHEVLLGNEILRHFRVTLDQVNHRVRFERSEPVIPPAPPIRGIGVSLAQTDDGVVSVSAVTDGGAAAAAGVRGGDKVVEIGGRPAAGFIRSSDLSQLVQRGEPIRFTVDRDGHRLSIDVTPSVKVQ